jgi:anti-sigma factor RsiW
MSKHHEINCEVSAESIALFASGDLPARDLAVIGEHLRSCEDCRRRLEELQRIVHSLAVVDPAWLETAGDTVLKRVAAELELDNQALSREPATVADNSRGGERNVSRQEQRGRRGWTWIALGTLAVGLAGIALSGWLSEWWKSVPEQPVVPELRRAHPWSREFRRWETACEASFRHAGKCRGHSLNRMTRSSELWHGVVLRRIQNRSI